MKRTFLIETGKNKFPVFDFQYELINAIDFTNWMQNGEENYQFRLVKNLDEVQTADGVIPVGSLEFVSGFLRRFYNVIPKPLNIPEALRKDEFLKRRVFLFNPTKDQVQDQNKYFVKSCEVAKEYTELVRLSDIPKEDKDYLVSEEAKDIICEYRCFVLNDHLIDIRRYIGDPDEITYTPDLDTIKKAIETYKGKSRAYTLDVGVNKDLGTFIIELHNFWSCGLYGFSSPSKLIAMTIHGFETELAAG